MEYYAKCPKCNTVNELNEIGALVVRGTCKNCKVEFVTSLFWKE